MGYQCNLGFHDVLKEWVFALFQCENGQTDLWNLRQDLCKNMGPDPDIKTFLEYCGDETRVVYILWRIYNIVMDLKQSQ